MTVHLGEFKTGTDWQLGTVTVTDNDTPVNLTASGVTVACQLRPHEHAADDINVVCGLAQGASGIVALSVPWESAAVSAGIWRGDLLVDLPSKRAISQTFEVTVVDAITEMPVAP